MFYELFLRFSASAATLWGMKGQKESERVSLYMSLMEMTTGRAAACLTHFMSSSCAFLHQQLHCGAYKSTTSQSESHCTRLWWRWPQAGQLLAWRAHFVLYLIARQMRISTKPLCRYSKESHGRESTSWYAIKVGSDEQDLRLSGLLIDPLVKSFVWQDKQVSFTHADNRLHTVKAHSKIATIEAKEPRNTIG